jgi:hypothetical protein
MTQYLYRFSLPWATFGVVVGDNNFVIDAAPIARWTIGKHITHVQAYYTKRGAEVLRRVIDGTTTTDNPGHA